MQKLLQTDGCPFLSNAPKTDLTADNNPTGRSITMFFYWLLEILSKTVVLCFEKTCTEGRGLHSTDSYISFVAFHYWKHLGSRRRTPRGKTARPYTSTASSWKPTWLFCHILKTQHSRGTVKPDTTMHSILQFQFLMIKRPCCPPILHPSAIIWTLALQAFCEALGIQNQWCIY